MRGLAEAVCVTPPASSGSSDIRKGNSLALTTASSGEQTILTPGWYTFLAVSATPGQLAAHIAFYTVSAGLAAALQADWPLFSGVEKNWFIDFPPVLVPGSAYNYFKAIADAGPATATLYWGRSS